MSLVGRVTDSAPGQRCPAAKQTGLETPSLSDWRPKVRLLKSASAARMAAWAELAPVLAQARSQVSSQPASSWLWASSVARYRPPQSSSEAQPESPPAPPSNRHADG